MVKTILKFALILFLIDLPWLSRKIHAEQVFQVQQSPLSLDKRAAASFYLLAGFAYWYFIHGKTKPVRSAAILGGAMYGTFDLTNKAIFKNYSWSYAIQDTAWGVFAFSLASWIMLHNEKP